VANACVDSQDFKTDAGGKLQLNPATAQNASVSFSHALSGVNGTFETITEFPAVTIPRDGLYLVTWDIHGYAGVFPNTPGAAINQQTLGAISIGNVFQAGTETAIASVNIGGSPSVGLPAMSHESTGSGSRVFQLLATNQIRIMGAHSGAGTPNCFISSGPDGRCRITAVRIST
jgi:hypothetical protein